MNRNLVIVLAGGFLIAVLVAVLVQAGLKSGKKANVEVKEEPRVQIVVAAMDLSAGTTLSEKSLKWQDWPENAVFPGAIMRKDKEQPLDLIQGVLKRSVAEGEPVVESALVKETAGNFVAASLGEGMRAVAVPVKAETSAGGFVGPGDYVDVLLTYNMRVKYNGPENPRIDDVIERNIEKSATETILQNVKVLAVDQEPRRDEEKGIKVGKTVTLEVDLKGAETLALAMQMGDLILALRKLGDNKIYERNYQVVTDARLTTIQEEVFQEIAKAQNNTGQVSNIVRLYNGPISAQTAVGQ